MFSLQWVCIPVPWTSKDELLKATVGMAWDRRLLNGSTYTSRQPKARPALPALWAHKFPLMLTLVSDKFRWSVPKEYRLIHCMFYLLFTLNFLFLFFPLHSGRKSQACITLGLNYLWWVVHLFILPILARVLILICVFIFLQYFPVSQTSPYFFLSLLSPLHVTLFSYHFLNLWFGS